MSDDDSNFDMDYGDCPECGEELEVSDAECSSCGWEEGDTD